jgi:hypothetical protein
MNPFEIVRERVDLAEIAGRSTELRHSGRAYGRPWVATDRSGSTGI